MRKTFALLAALCLPIFAHALPMTWNYSGQCTEGDCGSVPTISGTLSGDPTIIPPSNQLGDLVLSGEVISYEFTLGSYTFSGSDALGNYILDATGNIVGGQMIFANVFSLEFLGAGATAWIFEDVDCVFIFSCDIDTYAAGHGSYAKVSEPGTLALLGAGLIAAGWSRRRKAA